MRLTGVRDLVGRLPDLHAPLAQFLSRRAHGSAAGVRIRGRMRNEIAKACWGCCARGRRKQDESAAPAIHRGIERLRGRAVQRGTDPALCAARLTA